jgi:hypothetical protein
MTSPVPVGGPLSGVELTHAHVKLAMHSKYIHTSVIKQLGFKHFLRSWHLSCTRVAAKNVCGCSTPLGLELSLGLPYVVGMNEPLRSIDR